MQPAKIADRPGLDELIAMIARSQIVIGERPAARVALPAGFGDADLAVLTWIAAEGRRIGNRLARM